jgi:hypothetical protein
MRIALVLALGLLAASPALAHPEDSDKHTATDPNKVVCKTEDVIGSRLQTQKHCMTVAQWTALQHEDYKVMDRVQGRSYQSAH